MARFSHYCSLKCPLKCAPASTFFSTCFKIAWTCRINHDSGISCLNHDSPDHLGYFEYACQNMMMAADGLNWKEEYITTCPSTWEEGKFLGFPVIPYKACRGWHRVHHWTLVKAHQDIRSYLHRIVPLKRVGYMRKSCSRILNSKVEKGNIIYVRMSIVGHDWARIHGIT